MRYPQQPWPYAGLLSWMVIFGFVATALKVGFPAMIVLGVIAMAMGLGRP